MHKGWNKLPTGWSGKSVKKFSGSLVKSGIEKKGGFEKCVERMRGNVANPEGFCAGLKDKKTGSTYWRGKNKSPQQAGKDIKAHKNVRKESLVSVYLEMLECGCPFANEPKYGDSDPLAQNFRNNTPPEKLKIFDLCMQLEDPIAKFKCLKLIRALGIDFNNPEYSNRIDREMEVISSGDI